MKCWSIMQRLRPLALIAPLVVAGCVTPGPRAVPVGVPAGPAVPVVAPVDIPTASGRPLAANAPIRGVIARVEPVAEAVCRARQQRRRCDFLIAVNDDPAVQPNAFQTLDRDGRPVIIITASLLDLARNSDELAFVIGHEAGHHIRGHIEQREVRARNGAILAGILGQMSGMGTRDVMQTQEMVAQLAARQYSKEYELEADTLGAEIAWRANYDPVRGAEFFARLPDPGKRFFATHPPSAQRQAVVVDTVRRLSGMGLR